MQGEQDSHRRGKQIAYMAADGSALDTVAALWEKIKAHHVTCATHFAPEIESTTFAGRKEHLLKRAGTDGLHVDRAIDGVTGQCVGYCITSVTAEHAGQIDSLFVEASHRRQHVGTELMRRALDWLAERGASSTIIGVTEGNEGVLAFYAGLGFVPRSIVLAQPKSKSAASDFGSEGDRPLLSPLPVRRERAG